MSEIISEKQLIKNVIKGDAFSFDEIFERYNDKIYAFSFSNLKNQHDAEEVVQEVFLTLWKDRAKLKVLKSLDAWIFAICYNIIRKHFRNFARERKHLEKYSETALSYSTSTSTEVEYNDLLEKAEVIIEQLPRQQKAVFLLSKKEGLSNTEISNKLNITKKTVENHLTRSKAFLKKAFVDERLLSLLFFCLFIK